MASQKNFAITPSVSISRSKFKRPFTNKLSFNLGEIVPVYLDADILPGDTVSMDLSALVRMSNPVAPIMDNIYIDYYAFFIPNRLVDDTWKQFMGENTTSYGVASDPGYPTISINYGSQYLVGVGSLGDYFGLPGISVLANNSVDVSALPGRAYLLVYNEWFRDQNLISPISINTSVGNHATALGTDPNNSNASLYYSMNLLKAAKESDYFTRALPYAQKGAPVKLPLGATAPLTIGADYNIGGIDLLSSPVKGARFGTSGGSGGSPHLLGLEPVSGTNNENMYLAPESSTGPVNSGNYISMSNLYADLSNATAATINQLRFAFQYQKFLEKDALFGSRYWEILKGHFSITAPDASLQRPELLGHFRQHINIDQVLQTTGSDVQTPANNTLGIPGANSVSGKSGHLISKSFVEHGILMVLAVARHNQTYGQGINRMWTRTKRTDFYFPVFANLGAQEIKNEEIYASSSVSQNKGTFGFQEAWAEYRYKPDQVCGILNPSRASSLGFWTLANNFAALPTLSKSFIEQDRSNLSRALVTGNSGPDFIADMYFDCVYVRAMPMYSIPGLIDHH